MQARVNGEALEIAPGTTIADLVQRLTRGTTAGGVAVARNREIVPRTGWPHVEVDEGDQIEVIRPSQGG